MFSGRAVVPHNIYHTLDRHVLAATMSLSGPLFAGSRALHAPRGSSRTRQNQINNPLPSQRPVVSCNPLNPAGGWRVLVSMTPAHRISSPNAPIEVDSGLGRAF
jgi:hypothetical protein